jgi:hypothetical protein
MRPNETFLKLPKTFWAGVRLISQKVGYTEKRTGQIKIPSTDQINMKMQECGIDFRKWRNRRVGSKRFGILLDEYFRYRAEILYTFVEPRLMDAMKARQIFEAFHKKLNPSRQVPMNKQSGEKKSPAYLTGLVNMIVEAYSQGLPCDYDPQQLTLITRDGLPVRTLARRVDGAFPSSTNPVAIWEIKEYYYTTTFGSRVADGIYESLLDGLELEELKENENIDVKHCLMIDAHDTWWILGKSYLCRVIDMLHMGYLDEVLFGYEVVERLPALVSEWVQIAKGR